MKNTTKKNLVLYLSGMLVSNIGSGVQFIAIPLYLLSLTNSATLVGVFTMLGLLPALIFSPFAGVLGDRKNRKKIMVLMDLGRGAVIMILFLLSIANTMDIIWLFISQVFMGLMNTLFESSTDAMLPGLVKEDELARTNSIRISIDALSRIAGPIIGGIVFGVFGIQMVFLINGLSFIISGISEIFIDYQNKAANKGETLTIRVFYEDIKEVLKFIFQNKGLLHLISYSICNNLIFEPITLVLFPFISNNIYVFGSDQYGFLQSFYILGIILGSILMGAIANKFKLKKLIKFATTMMASGAILLAVTVFPHFISFFKVSSIQLFIVISIVLVYNGIVSTILNIPIETYLQKNVPDKMLSRFFSLLGLILQAIVPLGLLVAGFLADHLPIYIVLPAMVTLFCIAVIIYNWKGNFSGLEKEAVKPPENNTEPEPNLDSRELQSVK